MDAKSVSDGRNDDNMDDGKPSPEKLKKYLAEIDEKIKTQQMLSTKPMDKDKNKYKSDVFEIWNVIYYSDKTLVKNIFQCKVCDKLMRVLRKLGNAQLRWHVCFQKHIAKKNTVNAAIQAAMQSTSTALTVDSNTLAKSLEIFTKLGHEYGPIESDEIKKILPAKYEDDRW